MTDHHYVCSSCGKTHDGLPTDWGFKLPDEVFDLSYLDKYRRSRFNTDLCALDEKRFFIRGILVIPFTHQEGEFVWGVWAEVSKSVHDFYVDNYSNELAQGVKAEGTLANTIPGFSEITGLPLEIELQSAKSRPVFTFPDSADHELAMDQRDGIDHNRHHHFLELCGHFDESGA
ncbi:MAG TPA: DUF2199 domain-containing protein [Pseudoxanthomonas sp.]|nr:DUF2199 domain-containing protein [Pseudoxanthomonas sp.]